MSCGGVVDFLVLIVIPIVSLYLCIERFRESQEKKQ